MVNFYGKADEEAHWHINKYLNQIQIHLFDKYSLATNSKELLSHFMQEKLIDNFQYIEGLEMLKQLKRRKKC